MYGEDNGSEGPRGTFEIYRAEADSLYKQGEYRKAIESYTIALELTPNEKNCLVARSKCWLQLGDMNNALIDAESSLEEDKTYHKGIYQKAQALYYQGDFEMALVFYHRGLKLRPELHEFRLGIQKAQEAIDNSVGCKSTRKPFPTFYEQKNCTSREVKLFPVKRRVSGWSLSQTLYNSTSSVPNSTSSFLTSKPSKTGTAAKPAPDTVKLTTEGDLSYFDQLQDDKRLKRKGGTSLGRPKLLTNSTKQPPVRVSAGSEKTIKQLLGELYGDRQYLEKLLKETDPQTQMGKTISNLVTEGLSYLDTRSDFWRQQKPMYARRHDRNMQRRKREVTSSKLSPNDYIIKELERIDQAQVEGRYQEALKRAQKCLSTVQGFSEDEVHNKVEVLANLHSCMGNAHLELGAYERALDSHQTDLNIGEAHDMIEAVSRGLDNIGRVHARRAEFEKAIEVWERKLPMSKAPLESTWLHHEIGRCYLELNKYEEAKRYGEQSEKAAMEAEDQMWHLQAAVLIAQAEVKLEELQAAAATFEKALELAKSQNDKSAETAIDKAIAEINGRIIAGEGKVVEQSNEPTGDGSGTSSGADVKSSTSKPDISGEEENKEENKDQEETKPAEEETKKEEESVKKEEEETEKQPEPEPDKTEAAPVTDDDKAAE